MRYWCWSEIVYANKQKGQLQAKGLFLILIRHRSCQIKKIQNCYMKHKRMTQLEYLHVDRTGLFGMIKAMQIKPRICTSEHPPSPGRPASHGKTQPTEKTFLQRLAPTTHQPLVPACSKHPQHYGTPGICWQGREDCSGRGTSQRQAGCPGPAVQTSAWAAAAIRWAPLQKQPPLQGWGDGTDTEWKAPRKGAGRAWRQHYSAGQGCREWGTCSSYALPGPAALLLEDKTGLTTVATGLVQWMHINLV